MILAAREKFFVWPRYYYERPRIGVDVSVVPVAEDTFDYLDEDHIE